MQETALLLVLLLALRCSLLAAAASAHALTLPAAAAGASPLAAPVDEEPKRTTKAKPKTTKAKTKRRSTSKTKKTKLCDEVDRRRRSRRVPAGRRDATVSAEPGDDRSASASATGLRTDRGRDRRPPARRQGQPAPRHRPRPLPPHRRLPRQLRPRRQADGEGGRGQASSRSTCTPSAPPPTREHAARRYPSTSPSQVAASRRCAGSIWWPSSDSR